MNQFEPPKNPRKIEMKEGNVVHTPESYLDLLSSYKRQNPVKFARKENAFKAKFVSLGGKIEDFKLKIVKSREELEAEIVELKAKIEPVVSPETTVEGQETPRGRGRPKKEEVSE